MSQIPSVCEHCRKDITFGEFELLRKCPGGVKNAVWKEEHKTYVQVLLRWLCAQCGFNIVNYRVAKHWEVPERVVTESGATSIRVREFISQDRPYVQCTLVQQRKNVVEVLSEDARIRYHEQVAALEEQRKARRLQRYEWKLRHIGTTVRDLNAGIEPLTEAEIAEELDKYIKGGASVRKGVSQPPVRLVVAGSVSPRKRAASVTERESSTSPQGAASALSAPSPRPTPRRLQ